jgi:hypothetical protein
MAAVYDNDGNYLYDDSIFDSGGTGGAMQGDSLAGIYGADPTATMDGMTWDQAQAFGSGSQGALSGAAFGDTAPTPAAFGGDGSGEGNAAYVDPKTGKPQTGTSDQGVFTKILQGARLADKEGNINYSDPKVMDQIMKMVGVGGNIIGTLMGPQNKKTPQEMQAQFKGPFDNFNPTAQAAANKYFNTPLQRRGQQAASSMQSPLVSGRRYAKGGDVEGIDVDDNNPTFHSQGALSLVQGPGGGQDDLIPARLGRGEYVFDADAVASLGDGSNERGAELLDKWREELRKHKRSAPPSKIPPKSKAPAAYMKGGK